MATGEELLRALSGAYTTPGQTGWGQASGIIAGGLPGLINPYGSGGANLGIAIGGGLLSALLAGQAQSAAASENAATNEGLKALMAAGTPEEESTVLQQFPQLAKVQEQRLVNKLINKEIQDREASRYDSLYKLKEEAAQKNFERDLDLFKQKEAVKAQYEANKPQTFDLPAPIIESIAKTGEVVDEATDIARELADPKMTWTALRESRNFAGLDQTGIGLRLRNLADKLGRSRSGAALSAQEEERYDKLINGDLSASPKQISDLLIKLANAERRGARAKIETVRTLKTNPLSAFSEEVSIGNALNQAVSNPTGVITKTLKDGTTVRVRMLPNGKYEEVE